MKKILSYTFIFITTLFCIFTLTGCKMTYRVTFYEDNGVTTYQDVKEGSCVTSYIASREGYQFLGWFTEEDQEFDFSTPITKNMNLYASYSLKEWKVSFIVDEQDESKNTIVTVETNKRVAKPSDPVKEDYLFMGWLLGSNFYDFNTFITGDITLKAYFEKDSDYTPKLIIQFNSINGGDFEAIEVRRLNQIGALPTPSKEGYEFIGWYLGDTLYTSETVVREISDFTLIAHYTKIE